MTVSVPVPDPLPSPGDRDLATFTRRACERLTAAFQALTLEDLEPILDELVWDAREFAAARVKRHARPDDRWGPQ